MIKIDSAVQDRDADLNGIAKAALCPCLSPAAALWKWSQLVCLMPWDGPREMQPNSAEAPSAGRPNIGSALWPPQQCSDHWLVRSEEEWCRVHARFPRCCRRDWDHSSVARPRRRIKPIRPMQMESGVARADLLFEAAPLASPCRPAHRMPARPSRS